MRVIRENLVGLFKFLFILLGILFPFRLKRERPSQTRYRKETSREEPVNHKYASFIGPSEPLIPTEPCFCPKCHVLVASLRRTKEGIKIIQNNRVLVTVGGNFTTSEGGKVRTGFPMKCPNGHTVEVQ